MSACKSNKNAQRMEILSGMRMAMRALGQDQLTLGTRNTCERWHLHLNGHHHQRYQVRLHQVHHDLHHHLQSLPQLYHRED